MKILNYFLVFIIVLYSGIIIADEVVKTRPVDKKLNLDQKILFEDESRSVDTLFKNMAVVQKKAIERNHKFIFDTHLSFNYSDTPKSINALVLGAGFGLMENLEIGFSFSPFIMSSDRTTVKEVRTYVLQDGSYADLVTPNPKSEMGVHLNWIFAYGKDAFGPFSLVHSDTFLKVFYNKIQYADSLSGNEMGISLGKTYFLTNKVGLRLSAGLSRHGYFINDKPQTTNAAIIEPGLVLFY